MTFDEIVEECLGNLSYEDTLYIKDHPDPIEYHHSFGMYIRNHYIYSSLCDEHPMDADGYSQEIIKAIFSHLLPDLDLKNDFIKDALSELDLGHVWIKYNKVFDEYPTAILNKYKDQVEQKLNSLSEKDRKDQRYHEYAKVTRDCIKEIDEQILLKKKPDSRDNFEEMEYLLSRVRNACWQWDTRDDNNPDVNLQKEFQNSLFRYICGLLRYEEMSPVRVALINGITDLNNSFSEIIDSMEDCEYNDALFNDVCKPLILLVQKSRDAAEKFVRLIEAIHNVWHDLCETNDSFYEVCRQEIMKCLGQDDSK